jgi:hypothetical protein
MTGSNDLPSITVADEQPNTNPMRRVGIWLSRAWILSANFIQRRIDTTDSKQRRPEPNTSHIRVIRLVGHPPLQSLVQHSVASCCSSESKRRKLNQYEPGRTKITPPKMLRNASLWFRMFFSHQCISPDAKISSDRQLVADGER